MRVRPDVVSSSGPGVMHTQGIWLKRQGNIERSANARLKRAIRVRVTK